MSQSPASAHCYQPGTGCAIGHNRFAVELAIKFFNPGLPRQPWALRHHSFAVKQFKPEDRGFSKRCVALQNLNPQMSTGK
jgi:hypothetical protein